MKTFVSVLTCLLFVTSSVAQINFYIDGQLVDNSQPYQYETSAQSFQLTLEIENASVDTMHLTVDFCKLLVNPNWELGEFIWGIPSDPFGGVGFTVDMTDSCWLMPVNTATVLEVAPAPSENASAVSYLYVTAGGCELYRYYVMENGAAIDSIDIQYCSVLGTDELNQSAFALFPNPTKSELQIQSEKAIASIEIFDALGRAVQFHEPTNLTSGITLNVAELEAGSYFVSVYGPEGESSTQVLIIE